MHDNNPSAAASGLPAPSPDRSTGRTSQALTAWWRGLHSGSLRLNLALQGGGAHGAFTWGVLEALLGDPRIGFEGLSGSSAGAMNAVILADGWLKGGRDGARQGLADFWAAVGQQMPLGVANQAAGDAIGLSAAGRLFVNWAAHFSPSQLNPFDLSPLRGLIERQVDFEQLRTRCPFKLFVGTTQANTGKLRIFREHELTADVLLASACLPKFHHAVEIGGEPYWDGGYCANPAVHPLFFECESRDVLLVLLSPLKWKGTPRTVQEIDARILDLAFSANFNREMQMLAHATQFASPTFLTMGRLERRLRKARFHMIDSSDLASLERSETKMLAHPPFLELLRTQGRERGAAWLMDHSAGIGRRSTVDMKLWLA